MLEISASTSCLSMDFFGVNYTHSLAMCYHTSLHGLYLLVAIR
ncbi:hypothetical protein BMETH_54_1 [methanotrophic bacterial endosymbiont of Bathymodiolus sp.]|nr:hypothetical protein BMETH_54_1 [methanotrophic bacterial endosymbiont of Bathymodiolus sp.]